MRQHRGLVEMSKRRRLLDDREVDLGQLNSRELRFLRDLQKMADEGVSYFEIYRSAVGPGSPALAGRNRVDRRIVESPLYMAARDIATRAGVGQRLVLAHDHALERATAPTDASMMSAAQAADLIGITRAAVYKAIDKGSLRAIPVGNVILIDRKSALAYRDRRAAPSRRTAGRASHVARES